MTLSSVSTRCQTPTENCQGQMTKVTESASLVYEYTFCELHYRVMMNASTLARPRKTVKSGYVYFLYTPYETVKIGFSTQVVRRWTDLTRDFGGPMTPLAVIEGTEETEQEIHSELDEFRMYDVFGEQFMRVPEVTDYISALPTHHKFIDFATRYITSPTYSNVVERSRRAKTRYQPL